MVFRHNAVRVYEWYLSPYSVVVKNSDISVVLELYFPVSYALARPSEENGISVSRRADPLPAQIVLPCRSAKKQGHPNLYIAVGASTNGIKFALSKRICEAGLIDTGGKNGAWIM